MTERKVTEKKVAAKPTAKKTTRRTATKKVASTFMIDAMSVGFKAGDVYQTLKDAENALSVAEIAKAANITTEETLLGMGWLLKEGKIKGEDNKFLLA
ncbi:winged helix-turn-helix domain-containing protein [Prevotella pectinovora]|jgi:hypothetical protein|uniref:winged helix-turn-helix domain-containing protein n=1 Tax=Prevotella pectinovora TaxID=1602169 RepID=UPI0025871BC7|nr:winged helix-turn-helix domain-containing protein [uncultured Prevotella sp.]